mmetsp:Transcript_34539/g.97425  ORF Transcript_34539/g.97425 Transcript_34539/m.97425 type:complete len:236 (-) Transcript_34539:153-860(-)
MDRDCGDPHEAEQLHGLQDHLLRADYDERAAVDQDFRGARHRGQVETGTAGRSAALRQELLPLPAATAQLQPPDPPLRRHQPEGHALPGRRKRDAGQREHQLLENVAHRGDDHGGKDLLLAELPAAAQAGLLPQALALEGGAAVGGGVRLVVQAGGTAGLGEDSIGDDREGVGTGQQKPRAPGEGDRPSRGSGRAAVPTRQGPGTHLGTGGGYDGGVERGAGRAGRAPGAVLPAR